MLNYERANWASVFVIGLVLTITELLDCHNALGHPFRMVSYLTWYLASIITLGNIVLGVWKDFVSMTIISKFLSKLGLFFTGLSFVSGLLTPMSTLSSESQFTTPYFTLTSVWFIVGLIGFPIKVLIIIKSDEKKA